MTGAMLTGGSGGFKLLLLLRLLQLVLVRTAAPHHATR